MGYFSNYSSRDRNTQILVRKHSTWDKYIKLKEEKIEIVQGTWNYVKKNHL